MSPCRREGCPSKVLHSAEIRRLVVAWERWRALKVGWPTNCPGGDLVDTLPAIARTLSWEQQKLEAEWRSFVGEDRAISAELAAAAEIAVERARLRALTTLAATLRDASRTALRRELRRWHHQARQKSLELKATRAWCRQRLICCWTSWKAWLAAPPFQISQLRGACALERSVWKLVRAQLVFAVHEKWRPSSQRRKPEGSPEKRRTRSPLGVTTSDAWALPYAGTRSLEMGSLNNAGETLHTDAVAVANRADSLMRLKVRLAWHADFANRCFGVAGRLHQAPCEEDSLVCLKERLDRGAACLLEYTLASVFRAHLRWALNSLLSAAAAPALQKPRHRLLAPAPALKWA
ncbi:unnamed protein product [Symbiodinium natans]|uniref:Uncharacterized protein n=1 Tax=Symbiodinium natans TaxID=878477 RepID=A0A812TRF0_9DINO|nr:unnamed protein product [Symbiodinium natans]